MKRKILFVSRKYKIDKFRKLGLSPLYFWFIKYDDGKAEVKWEELKKL